MINIDFFLKAVDGFLLLFCWRIEIICIFVAKTNYYYMIRQCFIIFGCLALGELVVWLTGIPIPSSIIGMLLLAALLQIKAIKVEWVKGMSDFLISNMGFFFVPPGVALMLYLDVIKAEFVPIVVATVVSTVLVLIVTGWTHQGLKNRGLTPDPSPNGEGSRNN